MAQETIVAVFDTAAHAQAAVRDVEAAGIPSSDITQHASTDITNTGGATGATTMVPPREEPGFWSRLFGTETEDQRDRMVYDRTVESGGVVVTVRVSDADNRGDRIMQILEGHNPVDIEERAAAYGATASDTAGRTTTATGATVPDHTIAYDATIREPGTTTGTGMTGAMAAGTTAGATATGLGTTAMDTTGTTAGLGTETTGTRSNEGQTIQLSEEALQVGKRTIDRGTTRIRRYVVETPVEENVTLRNESVSVERRPVSGTGTGRLADDAFTEKTVEMTEMDEEAVVGKTARVTEEVVVRKDVDEHVETVRDTVRKEKLDVEKSPGTAREDLTPGSRSSSVSGSERP